MPAERATKPTTGRRCDGRSRVQAVGSQWRREAVGGPSKEMQWPDVASSFPLFLVCAARNAVLGSRNDRPRRCRRPRLRGYFISQFPRCSRIPTGRAPGAWPAAARAIRPDARALAMAKKGVVSLPEGGGIWARPPDDDDEGQSSIARGEGEVGGLSIATGDSGSDSGRIAWTTSDHTKTRPLPHLAGPCGVGVSVYFYRPVPAPRCLLLCVCRDCRQPQPRPPSPVPRPPRHVLSHTARRWTPV